MGGQKLQVLFDDPLAVYIPGQNVSGRIVLVVNEPMKLRGLFVHILGTAYATWEESEFYVITIRKVRYVRKEIHIKKTFALIGGGKDHRETIPPGKHTFSFNFELPMNIPSTFKRGDVSPSGKVEYTVQAVADRPWKFDIKDTGIFTVVSPLDLNAYPVLLNPVITNKEKTLSILCFASGVVTIHLTLPRGGVVPGETLYPTLVIENNSGENVGPIKLKFVEETILVAGAKTHSTTSTISEKRIGHVEAGKNKVFDREAIPIPPMLPPSNLYACGIIDVNYRIEAHCNFWFPHKNSCVKLPVVMGTIPFQQNLVNMINI